MSNALEEAELLRQQAARAAIYLQRLIQKGDLRAARTEMHGLGVLGQVVAMELIKLLTPEQQEQFTRHLTNEIAEGAPRIKYRKSLRALAEYGDALK